MYKDKTNEKLKEYYNKFGLMRTLQVAYKMLQLPDHKRNKNFKNSVHGELCETVLEICIIDFMNSHKDETKDWFYSKGLILKDIESSNSKYLTELDLTLFTPYKVLTFECKSYGGDKQFIDECTVVRKGIKDSNVYSQHEKHYITLMKNIKYFRNSDIEFSKIAPLQIGYFDFSLGTVQDNRIKKWRAMMPIINYANISKLLTSYLNKPECWNMKMLKQAIDIIDKNKDKNTKKHLTYVKSLHGKN